MKIIHVSSLPTFRMINHQKTIYFGSEGSSSPAPGLPVFRPDSQTEAWYRINSFSNKHQ